jgi:integrase
LVNNLNPVWKHYELRKSFIREKKPRFSEKNIYRNLLDTNESKSGSPQGVFTKACKKAGVEDLTFHDLRHTFTSRLIANGKDLNTVKELVGHS